MGSVRPQIAISAYASSGPGLNHQALELSQKTLAGSCGTEIRRSSRNFMIERNDVLNESGQTEIQNEGKALTTTGSPTQKDQYI